MDVRVSQLMALPGVGNRQAVGAQPVLSFVAGEVEEAHLHATRGKGRRLHNLGSRSRGPQHHLARTPGLLPDGVLQQPAVANGVLYAGGRFTGGGHQLRVGDARVTRGLTIHCDLLLGATRHTPLASLGPAIADRLPSQPAKGNFGALPYQDVPALMGRLEAKDETALKTADAIFKSKYAPYCPNGF